MSFSFFDLTILLAVGNQSWFDNYLDIAYSKMHKNTIEDFDDSLMTLGTAQYPCES